MSVDNPLLKPFDNTFNVAPFDEIRAEHYVPAIEVALDQARKEIDEIKQNTDEPSFENTIEALEHSGALLDSITPVLFNLNSAETNDALQQVTQEVSPQITAFSNEVNQDAAVFEKVKNIYERRHDLDLDKEQARLLEKVYKDFVRSGANLRPDEKEELKELSVKLASLSLKFGEHVLAETNSFTMKVTDKDRLTGLPGDLLDRAADLAKSQGEEGAWHFTLQAPSFVPFMEYADDRQLREELYRAYMKKGFQDNDHNNEEIIQQIINLRCRKAQLLGYETYAEYVLEERMAKSPEKVVGFLEDLLEQSFDKAKGEKEELEQFVKNELGEDIALERWDWAYYSEKLRKAKFDFDDEVIKPYFRLESVIDGVFKTSERLYGISFQRNEGIPTYHEEVDAFEVTEGGETVALLLTDFFPRAGKRPGAWMTSYRGQKKVKGNRTIPIISIVCNFTPSSEGTPSLLKFDEVKTLFHEFGHALHGMLSDTTYESLASPNVFWDFVELPSQIFENWCYEKECLDLFARHYETGETIPDELISKLRSSSTYHEAYATLRQLSFGMLDMAYHHMGSDRQGDVSDIRKFEHDALKRTDLFPEVSGACMSTQFGHIFAGGYAAGYYSYKWAEVLDADSFALFQEKGVFDHETATAFRTHILSRGGTEHPMDLYLRFRGKEPTSEALLRRAGLS